MHCCGVAGDVRSSGVLSAGANIKEHVISCGALPVSRPRFCRAGGAGAGCAGGFPRGDSRGEGPEEDEQRPLTFPQQGQARCSFVWSIQMKKMLLRSQWCLCVNMLLGNLRLVTPISLLLTTH